MICCHWYLCCDLKYRNGRFFYVYMWFVFVFQSYASNFVATIFWNSVSDGVQQGFSNFAVCWENEGQDIKCAFLPLGTIRLISIFSVPPSFLSFLSISFPPSLYLSVFHLPFLSSHPPFLFFITISFSWFWPCCAAGGVSVPWAGMEPPAPCVGSMKP